LTVDPRLVAATKMQLAAYGGARLGWKLGMGDAERIGSHPAVGQLVTLLEDGDAYAATAPVDLRADAEIAVRIGQPLQYAPALEIVDLGLPRDAGEVVAANIFHRAVAIGPFRRQLPGGTRGALSVDGVVRDSAPAPDDLDERLRAAGEVLAAVDERFSPGDAVITGSIVQVPIARGQHVVADFGDVGRVALTIA
jgi:2-keto-4-pentenoate hydratase